MIAHYFKLIWKRRAKNAFLFLQLIFVFWVVFGVFAYGISKYNYYASPLGFDWKDMYRMNINFQNIPDTSARELAIKSLKSGLEAMPEIDKVSYSVAVSPYLGNTWGNGNDNDGFNFNTKYTFTDEDYFDAWKIKLKAGRYFSKSDEGNKYMPVVVTQKFVDSFLKDKNPIGFRFRFFNDKEAEIIGVAENFKFLGDFTEEKPFAFLPIQSIDRYQMLNFRIKPGTPVEVEKKINDLVENTLKSSDFTMTKIEKSRKSTNSSTYIPLIGMSFLALFLLVNIAMGLFGILRYNIAKRIPEIGLRKVIGATSGNIRRQFTGEMMVLALLAFLIATFFAVQLPFITNLPFGNDDYFMGMGLGTTLVFAIVYLCSLAPSHQASVTLPAKALREE
jgi:putative ABC transport system permease protein